jgi:hypothetical protein
MGLNKRQKDKLSSLVKSEIGRIRYDIGQLKRHMLLPNGDKHPLAQKHFENIGMCLMEISKLENILELLNE